MFKVTIKEATRDLNAIEKMRINHYSDGEKIHDGIQLEARAVAFCEVENDDANNKFYEVTVVLTDSGTYYSSSPVFKDNMQRILDELKDIGVTWDTLIVTVGSKASKKYPDRRCIVPQFVNALVDGFERA